MWKGGGGDVGGEGKGRWMGGVGFGDERCWLLVGMHWIFAEGFSFAGAGLRGGRKGGGW